MERECDGKVPGRGNNKGSASTKLPDSTNRICINTCPNETLKEPDSTGRVRVFEIAHDLTSGCTTTHPISCHGIEFNWSHHAHANEDPNCTELIL